MFRFERNIMKGFLAGSCMGLAGLIPGVSSATVAVITGVYRPMIEAAHNLFSREAKEVRHLVFFLALIAGLLLATFGFAHGVEGFIDRHPENMQILFIGLILGTLPLLWAQTSRQKIQFTHLLAMVICLCLTLLLGIWQPAASDPIRSLSLLVAIRFFFAGIFCASAALIPGISGSAVLMALGMYATLITAIRELNLPLLLVLLAGVLCGLAGLARIIHYLVREHAFLTSAGLTGFLLGSAINLRPPLTGQHWTDLLIPGLLLSAGFLAAFSGFILSRKKDNIKRKEKG